MFHVVKILTTATESVIVGLLKQTIYDFLKREFQKGGFLLPFFDKCFFSSS